MRDRFGPEHLIPRAFDPRLISTVAPAVAEAAMKSGVATQPIADLKAYRDGLQGMVYRSGAVMQPVFAAAAAATAKRVVYAEGEDDRVLRAVQAVVDEKLARPILVGRPEIIEQKARDLGLRVTAGQDFEIEPLEGASELSQAAEEYYRLGQRRGVTRARAEAELRQNATLVAAMLVHQGKADGLLCGLSGGYAEHLRYVRRVIGLRQGVTTLAAMNLLMLQQQTVFICDTEINADPSAEQLAEIGQLAAEEIRRFGLTPRVAMLSHSSFGSEETPSALKMRRAAELLAERVPDLEVEGELQGDAALSRQVLDRILPEFPPDGRSESAHNAQPGRGEHHIQLPPRCVQPGRDRRAYTSRRGQAREYTEASHHRPGLGQHDRADRGRVRGERGLVRITGAENGRCGHSERRAHAGRSLQRGAQQPTGAHAGQGRDPGGAEARES